MGYRCGRLNRRGSNGSAEIATVFKVLAGQFGIAENHGIESRTEAENLSEKGVLVVSVEST